MEQTVWILTLIINDIDTAKFVATSLNILAFILQD